MSLRPVFARLLADMDADVLDYRTLQGLLDAQFAAALAHDGERLQALAAEAMTLVEAIEARRAARVDLVAQLLPRHRTPAMKDVLASLPATPSAVLATRWQTLEDLVRDCKERNARNGRLMADQQALLQRVLAGREADTYAIA